MDGFVAFAVDQVSVTSRQSPICVMTLLVFVDPVSISVHAITNLCHEF